MTAARTEILSKLRRALAAGTPFPQAETVDTSRPVVPINPDENLLARFCSEVERVRGIIHLADSTDAALAALRSVLHSNDVTRTMCWDAPHLPFDGVTNLLATQGIEIIAGTNEVVETAQAGITGCDWAIAATGTLVLSSGPGRSRMASLLPPIHVALMRSSQLIPRLEDWVASRYADRLQQIRTSSNITFITGSSRTSDIEMQPVFGVHGPLQIHIVILKDV
ncbi:MAG: lactate utilization protein [Chloroflexi bacterium]|nr:lactate utilization protein [Chloroflexota bacterium]